MKKDKINKISAVIITFNEAEHIANAINSLKWADELIVLDSFSTDETIKIAESLGAKVFKQKFLGYFQQKNQAVKLAKYDWIFSIDADEAATDEIKQIILTMAKQKTLDEYQAYSFNRRNFKFGCWIKYGGNYPDKKLRLFNRNFCSWKGPNPHEKLDVNGKIKHIKADIMHYTAKDINQSINKNIKYAFLKADTMFKNKQKYSLIKMITGPSLTFIMRYFVKKGFLDGTPGFIDSMQYSYITFLKHAKLWELYYQQKQQRK